MTKEEAGDEEYYFDITLLIIHPSMDPNIITFRLGLRPYATQTANADRFTPKGQRLEGKWDETRWNHVFRIRNKRNTFAVLLEIIEDLKDKKEFFLQIDKEGGTSVLIVNMPGIDNLAGQMSWQQLSELVDLKIGLGMEIFPDWFED